MTATEDTPKNEKGKFKATEKMSLREQEGMNVLIVDDEVESVLPLKRVLQDHGCTVFFLKDGSEAQEFLSGNENVKLVFLDWNMPVMEGGETLAKAERDIASSDELTEAWSSRNIPVVTYTSAPKASIQLPATSHFAVIDYWSKSMKFNELRLQVESVMAYLENRGH
jgi:CheY-like chemotaxis protein